MPLDKKIPVIWVGLTYLFMAGGDGNLPCMDGNLPCDIKGYSKTPIRPLLLPFHPPDKSGCLKIGIRFDPHGLKIHFRYLPTSISKGNQGFGNRQPSDQIRLSKCDLLRSMPIIMYFILEE